MIKKKYIQLDKLLIRTYKKHKLGSKKQNSDTYIYTMLIDNLLKKYQVIEIKKYANCIIYIVELLD